MIEKAIPYEQAKRELRLQKVQEHHFENDALEDEWQELTRPRYKFGMFDVAKLGTGVVIGGGIGLLVGVATIAVAASVAEIIIGGVITKVAGVVGGATGLGWGLRSIDKKSSGGGA